MLSALNSCWCIIEQRDLMLDPPTPPLDGFYSLPPLVFCHNDQTILRYLIYTLQTGRKALKERSAFLKNTTHDLGQSFNPDLSIRIRTCRARYKKRAIFHIFCPSAKPKLFPWTKISRSNTFLLELQVLIN